MNSISRAGADITNNKIFYKKNVTRNEISEIL